MQLAAVRVVLVATTLASLLGCGSPEQDGIAAVVFDPCELTLAPEAALPDELDSIRDAAAMWNATGSAAVTVGDPGDSQLPIRFEIAAPLFFGLYRDDIGEVVINRRLDSRTARAITVAHEVGHAFGLAHVTDRPSLMNKGNLTISPTADDVATLRALWGDCTPAPANHAASSISSSSLATSASSGTSLR